MKQSKKHTAIFVSCSFILLLIGMILAVKLGSIPISFSNIKDSIFNYSETQELMIIRNMRMPRMLCVLFTGGILGMTGAMIQGATRNPIAEPSILGVSQGATLVVAIFYALGIVVNTQNVMIASFIGAFISGIIVLMFISNKANGNSIAKILLAGTAMSTFFISLTTVVGLVSNKSQLLGFWVSGGFKNVGWSDFRLVAVTGTIGLGENPEKIRFMTLMLIIPLCAAAVAVGKNIAFLGLIVPQIVRKVLGEDYRKSIPCSFLLGAVFLTYADIAARLLFDPYETPIGVFTALIGVPFFIAAARKERG